MSNDVKLRSNGFTFKQFFVAHDKSPMKITTDSVLLGAWAPIEPTPKRVLDIGTGCGVIALMLAQRLACFENSFVHAIDIDCDAVDQCQENIEHSPFNNIAASVLDIKSVLCGLETEISRYDLIVCNPPYFETAVACRNQQRQSARYTEQLSHQQLFECIDLMLSDGGQFCVVLPFNLAGAFETQGKVFGFYLAKRLDVRYTPNKNYSLVLLCFNKQNSQCERKELCMRQDDLSYTEDFADLLKSFYLRF